jgi:serine/threonine-protein kinase
MNEPTIGTLINERYRLDEVLGQGGMGVVFQAHDCLLERDVAIKIVSDDAVEINGQERLLKEAQAVARLNHSNIVSVYDAGVFKGVAFIVMELVFGDTLNDKPPESVGAILNVTRQVCAALEHAHDQGVVHRDLKPENVMIEPGGNVRLMDFGLARQGVARITQEGTIVGTLFYLAPEMVQGAEIDGMVPIFPSP